MLGELLCLMQSILTLAVKLFVKYKTDIYTNPELPENDD